ncbi:hypothetical protein ILUMI_08076, partial [Ignelater luminosus]
VSVIMTKLQLFELFSKNSSVSQANTIAARKKMVEYIKSKMPGIREEEVLNKNWLNQPLYQPTDPLHQSDITATPKSQLRAVKEFHSLTDRSKRKRTKALVLKCRYFRTQKIGRKQNIEDLLHAPLVSSDMVISPLRPLPKWKLNKLSEEVLGLLCVPEINPQTQTTREDISDNPSSEESSESDVDSDL